MLQLPIINMFEGTKYNRTIFALFGLLEIQSVFPFIHQKPLFFKIIYSKKEIYFILCLKTHIISKHVLFSIKSETKNLSLK